MTGSQLPGGDWCSQTGRQNKLRALVSQAPPGQQHGQPGWPRETMSPAATGPWPLALEQKGSLAWLFMSSAQEYKRLRQTKTQLSVTVRGFLCSPTWKTEASCPNQNHGCFTETPEGSGGGDSPPHLRFCLLKCAHRMISFAFLVRFQLLQ